MNRAEVGVRLGSELGGSLASWAGVEAGGGGTRGQDPVKIRVLLGPSREVTVYRVGFFPVLCPHSMPPTVFLLIHTQLPAG